MNNYESEMQKMTLDIYAEKLAKYMQGTCDLCPALSICDKAVKDGTYTDDCKGHIKEYLNKDYITMTNLKYIVEEGFSSAEKAQRAIRYLGGTFINCKEYCDEHCPHQDGEYISVEMCRQCEIDWLNAPYDGFINFDEFEEQANT